MKLVTQSPEHKTAPRPAMREVVDVFDAEDMRLVRNEVAHFMTHNTGRISRQDQIAWFNNVYLPARARGEMIGYTMQEDAAPVGYGLITKRNGNYWVAGGLVESVRGRGLGKDLFNTLTERILDGMDDVAYLDVRVNNHPARGLYNGLGYTAVCRTAGLLVMSKGRDSDAA